MWVAVHIILDRTIRDDSKSRAKDEDLLLKLMPEHSDLRIVGSAKAELLFLMEMRLSESFAPFRQILLELASKANTYYRQSMARQLEGKQFTDEEIEGAFAEYVEIFEKHMPREETWEYLTMLTSI
jgi:hypothetical protein